MNTKFLNALRHLVMVLIFALNLSALVAFVCPNLFAHTPFNFLTTWPGTITSLTIFIVSMVAFLMVYNPLFRDYCIDKVVFCAALIKDWLLLPLIDHKKTTGLLMITTVSAFFYYHPNILTHWLSLGNITNMSHLLSMTTLSLILLTVICVGYNCYQSLMMLGEENEEPTLLQNATKNNKGIPVLPHKKHPWNRDMEPSNHSEIIQRDNTTALFVAPISAPGLYNNLQAVIGPTKLTIAQAFAGELNKMPPVRIIAGQTPFHHQDQSPNPFAYNGRQSFESWTDDSYDLLNLFRLVLQLPKNSGAKKNNKIGKKNTREIPALLLDKDLREVFRSLNHDPVKLFFGYIRPILTGNYNFSDISFQCLWEKDILEYYGEIMCQEYYKCPNSSKVVANYLKIMTPAMPKTEQNPELMQKVAKWLDRYWLLQLDPCKELKIQIKQLKTEQQKLQQQRQKARASKKVGFQTQLDDISAQLQGLNQRYHQLKQTEMRHIKDFLGIPLREQQAQHRDSTYSSRRPIDSRIDNAWDGAKIKKVNAATIIPLERWKMAPSVIKNLAPPAINIRQQLASAMVTAQTALSEKLQTLLENGSEPSTQSHVEINIVLPAFPLSGNKDDYKSVLGNYKDMYGIEEGSVFAYLDILARELINLWTHFCLHNLDLTDDQFTINIGYDPFIFITDFNPYPTKKPLSESQQKTIDDNSKRAVDKAKTNEIRLINAREWRPTAKHCSSVFKPVQYTERKNYRLVNDETDHKTVRMMFATAPRHICSDYAAIKEIIPRSDAVDSGDLAANVSTRQTELRLSCSSSRAPSSSTVVSTI